MKKLFINLFLISLLLTSCGHFYSYLWSYLNCIFYGECSELYTGESTQAAQLTATGQNDGVTLQGEWQNNNAEDSYILNYHSDGKLDIALYKEGEMERYDLGKYSVENGVMTIEMDNGTTSMVKYSIDNKVLTLSSYTAETEEIKTAN